MAAGKHCLCKDWRQKYTEEYTYPHGFCCHDIPATSGPTELKPLQTNVFLLKRQQQFSKGSEIYWACNDCSQSLRLWLSDQDVHNPRLRTYCFFPWKNESEYVLYLLRFLFTSVRKARNKGCSLFCAFWPFSYHLPKSMVYGWLVQSPVGPHAWLWWGQSAPWNGVPQWPMGPPCY